MKSKRKAKSKSDDKILAECTYLSYMVVTGVVSFSFVLLKLLYCEAADETFELFAYLLKQSKQNV